MAYKKILVVYYSRSGVSRKVAEEISRRLKCDIREIHCKTDFPRGFWGFQKALWSVVFNWKVDIHLDVTNLAKYDLVICGGPMWGSVPATPLRAFLEKYKGQAKKMAFFYTQAGGTGGNKFLDQAEEISGQKPVAFLGLNVRDLQGDGYQGKMQPFIDALLPSLPRENEVRVSASTPSQRPPEKNFDASSGI